MVSLLGGEVTGYRYNVYISRENMKKCNLQNLEWSGISQLDSRI